MARESRLRLRLRDAIRERFAQARLAVAYGVPAARLHPIRSGNCRVFRDLRDGVIYRVPRAAHARQGFDGEARLLVAIAPRMPCRVPVPERRDDWFGPMSRYPAIPGEAPGGGGDELEGGPAAWVEDLADALAALHGIRRDALPDGLEVRHRFTDDAPVRRRLAEARDAGDLVTAREVEAVLADLAPGFASGGVLLHGDLNEGNILIDPRTGKLTGLIDFGSWTFGPAEWDLSRPGLTGVARERLLGRYAARSGTEPDLALLNACDRLMALNKQLRRALRRA
jgi:aminoglycoside phosphotransferase (APT) family kinase protein